MENKKDLRQGAAVISAPLPVQQVNAQPTLPHNSSTVAVELGLGPNVSINTNVVLPIFKIKCRHRWAMQDLHRAKQLYLNAKNSNQTHLLRIKVGTRIIMVNKTRKCFPNNRIKRLLNALERGKLVGIQ